MMNDESCYGGGECSFRTSTLRVGVHASGGIDYPLELTNTVHIISRDLNSLDCYQFGSPFEILLGASTHKELGMCSIYLFN